MVQSNSEALGEVQHITAIAGVLNNPDRPLKERFRALFTLKNLGGTEAIEGIVRAFSDSSALLKHELAYCLGQMQDSKAIPALIQVLRDTAQEPMVRHEAGEALGAIGQPEALEVLEEFSQDARPEVAETCQLAIQRIHWLLDENRIKEETTLSSNPYASIDPAPPTQENNTLKLRDTLLDETKPLFERYRAMFSLRNKGDDISILALADGLNCTSALFRHEIGYVLGQVQNPVCIPQLAAKLADHNESEMVRHECAEALGAIATPEAGIILEKYLQDQAVVVKESCEIALDMSEYENSPEFQYADGLVHLGHK